MSKDKSNRPSEREALVQVKIDAVRDDLKAEKLWYMVSDAAANKGVSEETIVVVAALCKEQHISNKEISDLLDAAILAGLHKDNTLYQILRDCLRDGNLWALKMAIAQVESTDLKVPEEAKNNGDSR